MFHLVEHYDGDSGGFAENMQNVMVDVLNIDDWQRIRGGIHRCFEHRVPSL